MYFLLFSDHFISNKPYKNELLPKWYIECLVLFTVHYHLHTLQGPARIKERETGVEVLRLQVSDKDSIESSAWKAKFILHGDPENYFKIQTDPKTNEGILTVVKVFLCFFKEISCWKSVILSGFFVM